MFDPTVSADGDLTSSFEASKQSTLTLGCLARSNVIEQTHEGQNTFVVRAGFDREGSLTNRRQESCRVKELRRSTLNVRGE